MEKIPLFFLKGIRKIYGKVFGLTKHTFFNTIPPEITGQNASDLISNKIASGKPFMVSRMGYVEFSCVYYYQLNKGPFLKKASKYIEGTIDAMQWPEKMKQKIQNNAGFFPAEANYLARFSELMLEDIQQIDILGTIIELENEFKAQLKKAKRIGFEDLPPYNHKEPWSKALKGKKVLIIHPFVKSIAAQYEKRTLLFKNPDVLPEFDLITYKPVQSIADNYKNYPYNNWFEALEKMQNDIKAIDFDIAIIGCGAYGLPLAAFIKRLGKQAIHMGGSVQILFGIKGKRWEEEYDMDHFFNEHWIRPSEEEKPKNAVKVERGCYW